MTLTLSWKFVCYPHTWVGTIDDMCDLARPLGYEWFCWNGRIYDISGRDTGLLMEDVK